MEHNMAVSSHKGVEADWMSSVLQSVQCRESDRPQYARHLVILNNLQ